MPCRRLAIAVVSATLAVALTACTPEPAATPTPTGFANEEEAFAAAEETYRAYMTALELQNSGDERADPKQYLTGEALDSEIAAEQALAEAGNHVKGATELVEFIPLEYTALGLSAQIEADVCLDSSKAKVVDDSGRIVTPNDLDPIYVLHITFATVDAELRIATTDLKSQGSC
ncbi:hypothetical protein [Microbacterium sp. NPDC055683]